MIPGSNLLRAALGVIRPQGFQLERFTGRETNAAGYQVPAYADAVTVSGSVQAVPRAMYQNLGLDLSKEYISVYTSEDIKTVERDGAGDRIVWNGWRFVCESPTDWRAQDGWRQILAVRVGAAVE
jgi:hypothetical protein